VPHRAAACLTARRRGLALPRPRSRALPPGARAPRQRNAKARCQAQRTIGCARGAARTGPGLQPGRLDPTRRPRLRPRPPPPPPLIPGPPSHIWRSRGCRGRLALPRSPPAPAVGSTHCRARLYLLHSVSIQRPCKCQTVRSIFFWGVAWAQRKYFKRHSWRKGVQRQHGRAPARRGGSPRAARPRAPVAGVTRPSCACGRGGGLRAREGMRRQRRRASLCAHRAAAARPPPKPRHPAPPSQPPTLCEAVERRRPLLRVLFVGLQDLVKLGGSKQGAAGPGARSGGRRPRCGAGRARRALARPLASSHPLPALRTRPGSCECALARARSSTYRSTPLSSGSLLLYDRP
jgi:hypothetical protein